MIDRRERTNTVGAWMTEFFVGDELKGRLFRTFHPTIPFEIYTEPAVKSHRCNTIDEGEEWLLQTIAQETI